jgi:Dullard-like phosphatase family protein
MSVYKRNNPKEKDQNNILNNPDILFGLTHKDSFKINVENPGSRLTGDRTNSLMKNKNTIIHSNSTSHIRPENIMPSLEKNYNIININVNNLIINNNQNAMKNTNINLIKDRNNINNHSKVFSKAGNVIIGKMNNPLSVSKKKYQKNQFINNNSNNRSSSQKPIIKIKDKYNNSPSSDIQGVINDLMESAKIAPPNLNKINKKDFDDKLNIKIINNNNIFDGQLISDEKILGLHFKLWEGFFNMELFVDNKNGISNHVKKILVLIEKEFVIKNKNNNNIFKNPQLNKIYFKIIKIYFVLITYIKFLLVDFNYELTVKSNVKKLLSNVSSHLLALIINHSSSDMNKINKEFYEIYSKMIKIKKIRKSKDTFSLFCTNMLKNLDLSIYIIKQFSNNFFKIGYFKPIHTILFDIFLLIDNYSIEDVGNIIINCVLYYLLHKNPNEKKTSTIPSIISFGSGLASALTALGFIEVPAPYLPKLSENEEKTTYSLVLDLDETLVHFFFTPSGGTFLIRPFCFKFLEDMSKLFEVIIFTAATKDYADSILDVLDPNKKLINYRLYRHHTTICDITFVKDLTKIGRNLNRCLIIDNLADNFKLQPNNGIQCGTWTDDMKDTQLNDLGIILTQIIDKKPNDIKPIIKKLNDEVNKKLKNNINMNPFKDMDISKFFK